MTESEAIEKLKNMRLFMQITDNNSDCKFTEDDYKANEMAIQALEKQIPKKRYSYNCPVCSHYFEDGECFTYCHECGQRLGR